MADEKLLLHALRGYAQAMSMPHDVADMLYRLTDDVMTVLDVAGSGIAVADETNLLRYATASSDAVTEVEKVQEDHQAGPCIEAYLTQHSVTISDIAARSDWPDYRKAAQKHGFVGVAGVPISLGTERLGSLNIYDRQARSWTVEDIDAAHVLTDMAAGCLVHERLKDSERLAGQLQHALDSRVLIEQAKGILAADRGIPVDDAFGLLRHHARSNNTTLRVVAQAVVEEGFRPPADPG
jgi:GAF domain-containing protein